MRLDLPLGSADDASTLGFQKQLHGVPCIIHRDVRSDTFISIPSNLFSKAYSYISSRRPAARVNSCVVIARSRNSFLHLFSVEPSEPMLRDRACLSRNGSIISVCLVQSIASIMTDVCEALVGGVIESGIDSRVSSVGSTARRDHLAVLFTVD